MIRRLLFLPKDKLTLSAEAVSDSLRYAARRHSHLSDFELGSEVLSVTACVLVASEPSKFIGYSIAGHQIIEEVQS